MIEQSININVTSPGIPVSIYTKQYDSNSREIVATLWDGSAPYAMPSGASAMLRYRKPDGTGGLYDTDSHGNAITIADNVVTIPLDDQVMTAAGKVMAEVDIYGTNNMRIATFDFWVCVSPTVCEDSAITSSDYYNVLTQQIANALAAANAASASATDAGSNATLAQSWAIGGTDTRTGEDTNNANYWAQQAEASTAVSVRFDIQQTLTNDQKQQAQDNIGIGGDSSVTSVFGRTGAITAENGDYTADQVGARPNTWVPSNVGTVSLSTTWQGESSPYTQVVTITGATVGSNSKIDLQPSSSVIDQMITDNVSGIYASNDNGVVTIYSVGNHPTANMTIQVTVEEVGL